MLIVFSGLPATGKSTISKELARKFGAVYIRIDTIEQGLRDSGVKDVGSEGYVLAYRIAEDNLRLGLSVVTDSVNPVMETRQAWREVATSHGARLIEIEIVCSDILVHRKRAENRRIEIEGLKHPSWADIQSCEYQKWTSKRIVIDTAGETPEQSTKKLLAVMNSI